MKKFSNKLLKYLILIIFICIVLYFVFRYKKQLAELNIGDIRGYVLSYGKFSDVMFILIYTLKPIFFIIPASLMSILAGNIFGPHKALMLSMIGCFGSGTVAFFLSRILGRSFVDKLLKGKSMTLDSNVENHGFKIMLIMRLSFIFPYDPLSYAAGLTKMKYRDFILGTLIGVLPEMVSYSFMGRHLRHPFSFKFVFPIILIITIALLSSYAYKVYKNGNNL
jgi:uncharacterized membrane protein YdjX (TVP38/TMEM64 family)